MQHPFINDLTSKSMDDLQTTISELSKKLTFAYRMQNQNMANQVSMVMESYKVEMNKRMDELFKKQNLQGQINIKDGEK